MHSLALFDIVDAAFKTIGGLPLVDLLRVGPVKGENASMVVDLRSEQSASKNLVWRA